MIPEPPEIFKQVKIIGNQERDPVKKESILERLFRGSLSDKTKFNDYYDYLSEVRNFNYENLAFFDPHAKRKIIGSGFYPLEKITVNDELEPRWMQLWDFDFYEKNNSIVCRKVYVNVRLINQEEIIG